MNTCTKTASLLLLILGLCLALPRAGSAGSITDDLRASVDKVLSIMQDPAYAAPEKKAERNRLIHAVVIQKFDWEEMSRRTLGVHWKSFTPAQQKEFIAIFDDFLERTYIAKVDLFLQEEKDFSTKNMTYANETVEGRYALVESKIALKEEHLPLSYKLINKDGRWVVYDMTIEGIGIVANYRTQFNEILANGNYEILIEKLKSKQGEDITGKAAAQGAQTKP